MNWPDGRRRGECSIPRYGAWPFRRRFLLLPLRSTANASPSSTSPHMLHCMYAERLTITAWKTWLMWRSTPCGARVTHWRTSAPRGSHSLPSPSQGYLRPHASPRDIFSLLIHSRPGLRDICTLSFDFFYFRFCIMLSVAADSSIERCMLLLISILRLHFIVACSNYRGKNLAWAFPWRHVIPCWNWSEMNSGKRWATFQLSGNAVISTISWHLALSLERNFFPASSAKGTEKSRSLGQMDH